jgi:peroxiredoxin
MSERNENQPPAVGSVAPDFTLPDSDGTERRLSSLCRERAQVLVFYRGHW